MKNLIGTRGLVATAAAVTAGLAGVLSMPTLAKDKVVATPGVGIGVAKLGMTQKRLKQVAGNFDASYTLPSGLKADRADWKDSGMTTMMLKVFYDRDGKAVQIASSGSSVVTTTGITTKSSAGDVMVDSRQFKLIEYRAKNGRVDYYDNTARGIAYEFRRLDEDLARKLYAIIVHKSGGLVMPDVDEVPLKK